MEVNIFNKKFDDIFCKYTWLALPRHFELGIVSLVFHTMPKQRQGKYTAYVKTIQLFYTVIIMACTIYINVLFIVLSERLCYYAFHTLICTTTAVISLSSILDRGHRSVRNLWKHTCWENWKDHIYFGKSLKLSCNKSSMVRMFVSVSVVTI